MYHRMDLTDVINVADDHLPRPKVKRNTINDKLIVWSDGN